MVTRKKADVENRAAAPPAAGWTFLSNHAHVLICLARKPDDRLRDVAAAVGITERAVQKIVADLEAAGVITRVKEGRRNHYEIHAERPLRHPVEAHCRVGALLKLAL
ncbi:MAG: winged helix-turn-helix domain-containing protein [Planctomycetota bacterium]|nr:winged helix-turn-helix domain-containing protein [Planctomycetota bacterium]